MILKKLPLLILLFITLLSTFVSAALFEGSGNNGERKSIFDLLVKDERFKELVWHIEDKNLTSLFKSIKAGTVFAPVNEAFKEESDDNEIFSSSRRREKISAEQILYHVIPIAVKSGELWDGRLLDTKAKIDDVQQVVKVVATLKDYYVGADNGVDEPSKVIEADMDASNGVLHLVDRIVSLPVSLDETLSSIGATEHFYELARKARVTKELRRSKSTVFVAQDDVFGDEIDPVIKNYLTEHKEGRKDLARFLKHQIAPRILFSDELKEGKSVIKTAEGSEDLEIFVENKKGSPSAITVNGIKVIHKDIIACNGVIHVLENPLLPKHKKNFIELTPRKLLTGINATRFTDLFDEYGLGSYLDSQNDVMTILAPPNDALDEGSFVSKRDIKTWLKYHIVHGRYMPDDLQDGQLLETESHDHLGDENYQRLDVHITTQDQEYFVEKNQYFKKSIQFGRSGALADPIDINNNLIIYPIARSLVLPRDLLSRLPVNLELSTFVASIYASAAERTIEEARGITLFAPTNEAFARLGLLAKYLLQPEAKKKLEQVVTYHAVRRLYYDYETNEGEYRETTLNGADITLNKTKEGLFVRGGGAADGSDRIVVGQVIDKDILTSNGVIHTVDRVQLPSTLRVTNRNLLSAEGTNSLLNLLQRTNLTDRILDGLDKDKPYTILAPTDRAFGKVNLSHSLEDPNKLLQIARLHILPVALPRIDLDEVNADSYYYNILERDRNDKKDDRREHPEVPLTGVDLPTLKDDDYVVISKGVTGGYTVRVKGSIVDAADVINVGRASNGGGIIEIDRVLLSENAGEDGSHGLPWWAIALIVIGSLAAAALLAGAIYLAWRYYKSRREGYISLDRGN